MLALSIVLLAIVAWKLMTRKPETVMFYPAGRQTSLVPSDMYKIDPANVARIAREARAEEDAWKATMKRLKEVDAQSKAWRP